MSRSINLNIHWGAPESVWDQVDQVFAAMPGYNSESHASYFVWTFEDGYIDASLEPGGLQLYSTLPEEQWEVWYQDVKARLTEVLGYAIGEPEDGYEFKYDW